MIASQISVGKRYLWWSFPLFTGTQPSVRGILPTVGARVSVSSKRFWFLERIFAEVKENEIPSEKLRANWHNYLVASIWHYQGCWRLAGTCRELLNAGGWLLPWIFDRWRLALAVNLWQLETGSCRESLNSGGCLLPWIFESWRLALAMNLWSLEADSWRESLNYEGGLLP
jgi:hypothetical protein